MLYLTDLPHEILDMILGCLLYRDCTLRPYYEVWSNRSKNITLKRPVIPKDHRFSTTLLRTSKDFHEAGCRALYSSNVFEFESRETHGKMPRHPSRDFSPPVPADEFKAVIGSANANRIKNILAKTILAVDPRHDEIYYFQCDRYLYSSVMDAFANLEHVTMTHCKSLYHLVQIIAEKPDSKVHTIQVLDRDLLFDDNLLDPETLLTAYGWEFSHRVPNVMLRQWPEEDYDMGRKQHSLVFTKMLEEG